MFVDEIEVIFKAGSGGDGRSSFFPGKKSGPDGGNGGDGGTIYVKASSSVSNLNHFVGKHIISAENGRPGGSNNKAGANGNDLEVNLPVGSTLVNTDSNQELELTQENQRIPICWGGAGGKGNTEFKSPTNTTPTFAEKGRQGDKIQYKIILRLIADFGLIGLPNAGKSSILNELTNANIKVAGYPFTTLEPNLGVYSGKVIADIPGLIEGASKGKGLGINFLKHIEKVNTLLHCISSESENLIKDYKTVIKELEKFNPQLSKKRQIILLTKSDLCDSGDLNKKARLLKNYQKEVLPISILDTDSINILARMLSSLSF